MTYLHKSQPLCPPTQQRLTPVPPASPNTAAPNPLMCRACGRSCKSKAGLLAHQRNILCRAQLIEAESSDTMDT
ncbi:hypothetical protein M8J75_008746 [Diaphorina citri]|nr:hypothetical protein M8J75_008746 [Diaphorina citri]